MSTEELKSLLPEIFPASTLEEGGEWLTLNLGANELHEAAVQLRTKSDFDFDFLFCLTCIDWKTHLTMVYHLTSTKFRHNIVVRSNLDNNKPEIETVSHLWKTAEFHEREAYEMFGVNFINHPDLRLLILPEGWEGRNPLRKDFEDPVNMIKL